MAALRIQEIIDDIYLNSLPEDTIEYIENGKQLCWQWTNERTLKTWHLRLSEVKKSGFDKFDLCDKIRLEFVYGRLTAFEAQARIGKISNLKAFW